MQGPWGAGIVWAGRRGQLLMIFFGGAGFLALLRLLRDR